jgi:hypothetical protein
MRLRFSRFIIVLAPIDAYESTIHRRVREHDVGTRPMQGRDVSLHRGPGQDLDVGAETPAVHGEVDVQVVVVRRDDDGGRLFDAGLLEDPEIRRVADHELAPVAHPLRHLLDDAIVDVAGRQGSRRRASDASSPQDHDGGVGHVVDAEQLVVAEERFARAR